MSLLNRESASNHNGGQPSHPQDLKKIEVPWHDDSDDESDDEGPIDLTHVCALFDKSSNLGGNDGIDCSSSCEDTAVHFSDCQQVFEFEKPNEEYHKDLYYTSEEMYDMQEEYLRELELAATYR